MPVLTPLSHIYQQHFFTLGKVLYIKSPNGMEKVLLQNLISKVIVIRVLTNLIDVIGSCTFFVDKPILIRSDIS